MRSHAGMARQTNGRQLDLRASLRPHLTPLVDCLVGRDSSVGIATRYGLDEQGIESRWEAGFSTPIQAGPGAHPATYRMGTGSLSRR